MTVLKNILDVIKLGKFKAALGQIYYKKWYDSFLMLFQIIFNL